MKTILVTGASSGIGKATALLCAKEGYRVIVCARREAHLKDLVEEIREKYKTDSHYLTLDISKRDEVESSINNLPKEWSQIDVLVNNAGLALGLESIDRGDPRDWETMIDVNIKGLLYMTQVISVGMIQRNKGHIINIGSISGRETYPGGAVYCSTKHAVRALSNGMKQDWHGTHIRVTEIDPGFTQTEFSKVRFKEDEKRAAQVYKNTHPLKAEDVAEAIYFCISRPEHVDIREILITATDQSTSTMIRRD